MRIKTNQSTKSGSKIINYTINVRGLSGLQLNWIEQLINRLKKPNQPLKKQKNNLKLKSYPLGTTSHLSRKDIYDHL